MREWLYEHALRYGRRVGDRQAVACKVCAAAAFAYDVVDLAKTCHFETYPEGLWGVPVYYHRCASCGFVFTDFFDEFTSEQWTSVVYDADYYGRVDPDYAEVIYTGGDIVTIDDNNPSAEALAVRGGLIIAVGTRDSVMNAHEGPDTKVIDLGGKTLMPAFIDAHSHYVNALDVANQVQVYAPPSGGAKDVDSIVAELKAFAAQRNIPKGQLIVAYGYDDTVMPNGRLLNRDDLDAAFPDNPVRVDHVSMHGAVLNSLALKKYGYSAETVTPPGGVIVRKEGTNEPYGLIM